MPPLDARARLGRRALLTACGGILAAQAAPSAAQAADRLQALEARAGGRLGIAAHDTGSDRTIAYRADERFPMCSTFKLLAAAAVLAAADRGALALDQHVAFGPADLLAYAPITSTQVAAGFMTVDALCAAALEWSDNTAANLLLGLIGGPAGWTRYARGLGDTVSRLDRNEPTLNTATPGDPRDTTTPAAMLRDMHAVLLGSALGEASRVRLQAWLFAARVTDDLLRAGLPPAWRIGDKSGSGANGSRNDIGLIRPPGRAPILVSVYSTGAARPMAARDRVIAEAGRIIADTFGA